MNTAKSNKIQGLWIGNKLSNLEKLCINSFLKNGHEFYLYTYSDIEGIPEGTIILDGNEILPKDEIFSYNCNCGPYCRHNGSLSAFSNFFRYKLLLDRGGYWVDLDMVCLRPFDFTDKYVFSSEIDETNNTIDVINAGVIKSELPQSEAMEYAWETCKGKDKSTLKWGIIGPKLVREVVNKYDLHQFKKSFKAFCPVSWKHWRYLLHPDADAPFKIPDLDNIPKGVYAIHMSNEMMRQNGVDKNGTFHPDSVYEKLKKMYM